MGDLPQHPQFAVVTEMMTSHGTARFALHRYPDTQHQAAERWPDSCPRLRIGNAEAADWIEAVGAFIDYVKMRHIWVLLMTESETDLVRRKTQLYRNHSIDVFSGGIVFERRR